MTFPPITAKKKGKYIISCPGNVRGQPQTRLDLRFVCTIKSPQHIPLFLLQVMQERISIFRATKLPTDKSAA